ncbi:enoyl-CoA hydratase/isomerase family protein [Sphingobium indicum]|uniref:Enoyl-CoA hydratase/isomerase family protein n=1 Tax=Sphingobium indicum TaxID=332055 RepID=A0A4Q4J5T3_9SPHN|nr:enoyl-CoA hydratase/isomerase family protein [Sphingobium indicum]RYM01559.1 enoyl-CoA hydratase/isomerase family protein [Sphingobium indicum]
MNRGPERRAAVLIDYADGVLTLTKNNPDTGYGMTCAVLDAMEDALLHAGDREDLRAVVIDAGGDGFHEAAVMVFELKPDYHDMDREDAREIVRRGQSLGELISSLPVPVIGLAAAGARGGGLEMMTRVDMLYCTDAALFCLPEVQLGFYPGWGGLQHGARMMQWRRAQEFILLGEEIDGREAERAGLVTRSFGSVEDMRARAAAVCKRLQYCSPHAVARVKAELRKVWREAVEVGEERDYESHAEVMETRDFVKAMDALQKGRAWNYLKRVDEPPLATGRAFPQLEGVTAGAAPVE